MTEFTKSEKELFTRAIEKWGIDAQVDMAEEECAEFIVASKHYARGKCPEEDVIDELADLRIMWEQLSEFVGKEKVNNRVHTKMNRLGKRLENDD